MKVKQWICIGIFICAAAALPACKSSQQDDAAPEATYGAAQVKVYKVVKQRIAEKLVYTGQIEALKKMAINPDIGGKIEKIYVESGDRVRQGQILAEIDTRAIRLQVEQAEAAQAVAQASYNDARLNLERMERLKKEDAVSEQQYEKIKLAFETAESQLQQAKAAVNLAKYNLDVSIMEAPFSGVIAARNAEVGDVVNPLMGGLNTGSGILTLMDFSKVKIEIDISPLNIGRVSKGQPAWVKVSTHPERQFEGRVTVVNLAADPISRKFKVEVQADNPEGILRPNTFCEVILEIGSREDALAVPQNAILDNGFVFVAEGGKAVKREIELGIQNEDWVEITQGLREGDLVIVEGNYGLDDGAEITVQEGNQ